jgi:serine/threonine protein kinase/WD40 repeat protein
MANTTQVNGYELHEKIGSGGFGAVYRAYQPSVGREVAIKIILPHHASSPEFVRRFEVEAQVIARLEHMNIVPLYDYWRDPDGAYLVMRYMRGGSLRHMITQTPFDPGTAAVLLDQIAGALTIAHRNGVIHRDLKPENVLLDEDGNAYLGDFGIAKNLAILDSQTDTGDILGSPGYLSPEQAQGEIVSPRTDVYSLGVMLYELLAGEHPFPNTNPVEKIYKHLHEPLPILKNLSPDIEGAVNDVLQKATAKNPAHRYENAMVFAEAFRMAAAIEREQTETAVELLTPREQQVLHHIIAGKSNRQIADVLVVEISTVKWYIRQIYRKLNVHNRVQAIVRGRELNMVLLEDANGDHTHTPTYYAITDAKNPYKGLRAFETVDSEDFFGRDKLIRKLLARLDLNNPTKGGRFLAVVGPSGSGKSSVVKAGLIPALWRGDLPGSENWYVAEVLPGPRPLDELEVTLMRLAPNNSVNLREQLERDEHGLTRAAQLILPDDGSELLVVVDQFEEVFTLVEDESRRQHFLSLIDMAVTDPRSRVRVVVTLRADFYDRPLQYPLLGDLMREHMETVLPLSAEELQQVILKPADKAGIRYEEGLVARIIGDVNYQPGSLPLLQYALTELFDHRDGRTITQQAYADIGGTVGALAKRADELFAEFDRDGQETIRQMFMRLITLGEGTEDTRRRVQRGELLSIGSHPDLMDDVIDSFAEYRLLALDRDPATREPTVEVAHEALLREWERLRGWLNDSREDIKTQRQLSSLSTEWQNHGQNADYLVRGSRLEQLQAWSTDTSLTLTPSEQAFMDASTLARGQREAREKAQADREVSLQLRARRILQGLVAVFLVAAVVSIGLAVFAFGERSTAQDERDNAQNARLEAQDERDNARLQAIINGARAAWAEDDIETALALAVAANTGQVQSFQAEELLSTIAYPPGLLQVLQAETSGVIFLCEISPDGRLAALGGNDLGWTLFDIESGQPLHFLESSWGNLAFSPDSQTVVTTSLDSRITLWNVETGEEIRRYESENIARFDLEPQVTLLDVIFSPDGRSFYMANEGDGENGTAPQIIHWDIETGEVLRTLQGQRNRITRLAISPDGQRMLSAGWNSEMVLWDLETGEIITDYDLSDVLPEQTIWYVGFTAGGKRAAVRTREEGSVTIWDLEKNERITTLALDKGWGGYGGNAMVVSPDGQKLLVGEENSATLFGPGFPIATLPGQSQGLAFAQDGQTIMIATSGSAKLWDTRHGPHINTIKLEDINTDSIAVTSDGQAVLVGLWKTEDFTGLLWPTLIDTTTGEVLQEFEPFAPIGETNVTTMVTIAISPDDRIAMAGTNDGRVILWDMTSGEQLHTLRAHLASVSSAQFSFDSRSLITAGTDGSIILWDVTTGQEIRRFVGQHTTIWSIAFSPDERTIVSSAQNGTLYLWDVATGQHLQTIEAHSGGANRVAFSPDGRMLLSGGDDARVILWDIASGMPVQEFVGHHNWITHVAFSPDGQTIFSTDPADGIIQWDVATGQAIRRYWPSPPASRSSFVISVDGQSMFISSSLRGVLHYRLDSRQELIHWTLNNRYVRELNCAERETYGIEPACDEFGAYPTRTPYPLPEADTSEPVSTPEPQPSIIPDMTPRPILQAQAGTQSGEVAVGDLARWTYEGQAGEIVTIQVEAHNPADFDTMVVLAAPNGLNLNIFTDVVTLTFDPAQSQDIDPGTNTNSLLEDFMLPTDGTYLIEVSGYMYETGGSYTLTIESQLPE